ncbi:hypothetical protein SEVIR_6G108900v4 [Setaria viridis]
MEHPQAHFPSPYFWPINLAHKTWPIPNPSFTPIHPPSSSTSGLAPLLPSRYLSPPLHVPPLAGPPPATPPRAAPRWSSTHRPSTRGPASGGGAVHGDPAREMRDLARLLLSPRLRSYEYQGEDPLQPWLDCIKWVQESFSTDGECSELVVLYEQCVRTFWHDERYKDDLRFLEVWLEYAGNCTDAEVIYKFLEANQIGQGHAIYYVSYVSLLEAKNKLRKANEIFDLGIARWDFHETVTCCS